MARPHDGSREIFKTSLWLAAALSLIGVALLAACGGSGASKPSSTARSSSPNRTASLSTTEAALATIFAELAKITPPPTPTLLVAGPDVRPCTAADVTAGFIGDNGATMSIRTSFGIGNRSPTPCRLSTTPELVGSDEDGNKVPIGAQFARPCAPGERPVVCISVQPVLLLPGLGEIVPHGAKVGQAVLEISTSSSVCAPTPAPLIPHLILLLADDGGSVPIDSFSVASCDGQIGILAYGPAG